MAFFEVFDYHDPYWSGSRKQIMCRVCYMVNIGYPCLTLISLAKPYVGQFGFPRDWTVHF